MCARDLFGSREKKGVTKAIHEAKASVLQGYHVARVSKPGFHFSPSLRGI